MQKILTMSLLSRAFLAVASLIFFSFTLILMLLLLYTGYLSSELSVLAYDKFLNGNASLKFLTYMLALTMVLLTAWLLTMSLIFGRLAFRKKPIHIIETHGIRICANGMQPEGFIQWNNIARHRRIKIGPIKGGNFIKTKRPEEVWASPPFVDKFITILRKALSFGFLKKSFNTNIFGMGGYNEVSNNEIEKLLLEVTSMDIVKPTLDIEWQASKRTSNSHTIFVSLAFPALALAIGFGSHHFSYLWNEEVALTRTIRHFAHQGDPDAQTKLGWSFSNGVGTKISHREAVYWYQKAAEQDYAKGQYNLGIAYKSGIGIKRDYEKAYHWLSLAAKQGQPNSKSALGQLYYKGNGVEQSYSKAKKLYEEAINLGLTYPYSNLGYMYEKGEGVELSIDKAVEYYKKAAVDNNEYALKALKRLGAS